MFTLTCVGLSFLGHGPFRENDEGQRFCSRKSVHMSGGSSQTLLCGPLCPLSRSSALNQTHGVISGSGGAEIWGAAPTLGSWEQAPATAWGSEQNSCRLLGSEAIVCLRRFSTEAPAARRKRPWGARGTRWGHGGAGGTGHPGRKALSHSWLGEGAGLHWPMSPPAWQVEGTPVSMGPLSSQGLGFGAKGDVWEGLRKVMGRHVGEQWEGTPQDPGGASVFGQCCLLRVFAGAGAGGLAPLRRKGPMRAACLSDCTQVPGSTATLSCATRPVCLLMSISPCHMEPLRAPCQGSWDN